MVTLLSISIPSPAPTLPKPHYPTKNTISLPPLSKGGGLTARHKLLLCNVLLATHPPFLFTKLFCRQDGGIAPHPTINEIFHTPIFITNYTKISYISISLSFVHLYCNLNIIFQLPFISVIPHSAIFTPSFRYTSVPTISNPTYSHNIYLTLSQISRTALSATKASHNFQVFAMFPPLCRKI